MNNINNISIASFNARGLLKTGNNQIHKQITKFLRSNTTIKIDIICIQEIILHTANNMTEQQLQTFHTSFTNNEYVVSKHCAIISLNPKLNITNTSISLDQRIITATISDSTDNSTICNIANIYAPAKKENHAKFYDLLTTHPIIKDAKKNWILVGDFNCDFYKPIKNSMKGSINKIRNNFKDIFYTHYSTNHGSYTPATTFNRGATRSTLDYIFCNTNLIPFLHQSENHYLPFSWTDHNMLTVKLNLSKTSNGPGTWRFNPLLLNDHTFTDLLLTTLETLYEKNKDHNSSIQEQWDNLKTTIKSVAINYSKSKSAYRKNKLNQLKEQRSALLNDPTIHSDPDAVIVIEKEIEKETIDEIDKMILRTNTRWKEKGETNSKYFFNTLKQRQKNVTISQIKDPLTNQIATSSNSMLKMAKKFYENLYSPDPITDIDIEDLLKDTPQNIAPIPLCSSLTSSIPKDHIKSILINSPKNKSPGLDGISFEVYTFLLHNYPPFVDLISKIMNEALNGIFPKSWLETRMVLLFKKGDRDLLANWRPLSLINCDAKIFTKILTNRLQKILNIIINPFQTGFMKDRHISDNGWITQTLMQHLCNVNPKDPSIGILLDQEKAYDRVHPKYLSKVMNHLGIPENFIKIINDLFFHTKIHISINGWLSTPVIQKRGLRQGDPLSPLLFNIAIEPLLRKIIACPLLKGCPIPEPITWPYEKEIAIKSNIKIKTLAYADDVIIFLQNTEEWDQLQKILQVYSNASNAKMNLSKTTMMSLTGTENNKWIQIANSNHIEWHDKNNNHAIRYLGYPLYSRSEQLHNHLDTVLQKLQSNLNRYKTRNLSIKGRSMVINSLILSRIWHLLRVTIVPDDFIKKVENLTRNYIYPFHPYPSLYFGSEDKLKGGLGLINIKDQYLALHNVYLHKLIQHVNRNPLTGIINILIRFYTEQKSILPFLLNTLTRSNKISKVPQIYHLFKLLKKLPKLTIATTWPEYHIQHTPLKIALREDDHLNYIKNIPPNLVVKDILHYDEKYNMFTGPIENSPHKRIRLIQQKIITKELK